MNEQDVELLTRAGETWLELSLDRRSRGLEVWVKADPKVEEFMRSLSKNGAADPIISQGKGWLELGDEPTPLHAYRIDHEIDGAGWVLGQVCGPLIVGGGAVNLSFLQLTGISTDLGIRFLIPGPFSKDHVDMMKTKIIDRCRDLFRGYIVPVQVKMKIISG